MLHIFVSRAVRRDGVLSGAWIYVSAYHPDTEQALRLPCISMEAEGVPGQPLTEADIAESVDAAASTLTTAGVQFTKHNC